MLAHRKNRAQAMVEFALALPIFLLVVYGIMEAGRYIFMIQAVTTAAREGARYASASGNNQAGNLHYQDCVAIRQAAQKVGFFVNVPTTSTSNGTTSISIQYDHGPGTGVVYTCTKTNAGAQTNVLVNTGDRVTVTVTGTYSPLLPLVPFASNVPIRANSSRTLTGTIDMNPPTPVP